MCRLSIAEDGCIQIMKHDSSEQILAMLITSLGVDVAGESMGWGDYIENVIVYFEK